MSDEQARIDIISNVDKNYFVEAGAGSGKTTILVERMVAMIEQGIPVEKICTITFTVAAANEFYERFQKRLSQRSKDETDPKTHAGRLGTQTEETKERCAKALQNIDSCFMGTIDAFCNKILSEHPLEAQIPADSTIVAEDDIIDRYVQEYLKIHVEPEYDSLRDKYLIFTNIVNNPVTVFRNALGSIIRVRDAEFIYEKPEIISLEKKYKDEKDSLVRMFNTLLTNSGIAYEDNKDSVESWNVLNSQRNILTQYDWDTNITSVLNALKKVQKLRLKPLENIGSILGASEMYFSFNTGRGKWYALNEKYTDIINEIQDYQARVILDFVIDCMHLMSDKLRKEGVLNFIDYKIYLKEMLKKDVATGHKLIDYIYKDHSYFMIDEFQDTDPMEAEIFFYLAAETFDLDWRKCVPHAGSLFIVGDPKQSIYRFKNADIPSFKKVRSLFSGSNGEVLQLSSNFRSTFSLHQWFNNVFGNHLLKRDTEDQSKYEPITNKDKDDDYSTGVYKYTPSDKKDDTADVLNVVSTLVNNPLILNENGVMYQYRDIMIITGKKAKLEIYADLFANNSIPFRVEGNINFYDCPALKNLIEVYKAITYPDNNMYLYEALISNIYKLTPSVAMDIRKDISHVRLTGEFTSENPDIQKCIETLRILTAKARTLSPSAVFSYLMDELKIFAVCGNDNQEYVYYVLELLREEEASGEIASAEDAVDYLDKLITGENKLERCTSLDKNDNRIHLANLHKVKGLEAPIVILTGLEARSSSYLEKRVEYHGDNPECYVLALRGEYMNSSYKLKDKWGKAEKEKESAEAERIRQLYVAATRAKRILVIVDAKPWSDLSQYVEKDFFSSFKLKEPTPYQPEQVDGFELYEEAESIIKDDSASRKLSIKIHKPSDIEFETVAVSPEIINTKRNPKLIGTLVHRMMEVIVSSKDSIDRNTLISSLCDSLDKDDSYYADILNRVYDRMHDGGYPQVNGGVSDILNELLTANEVYCEVPFSYHNGTNDITTGIIDALYRKDDRWCIIDYKTNADGNNLDEEYRGQMNEYRKAFEMREGVKPEVYIYHIDTL